MKTAKEGQKVRYGLRKGVVNVVHEGGWATILLPRPDGWPFPDSCKVLIKELKRDTKGVVDTQPYEEAPF